MVSAPARLASGADPCTPISLAIASVTGTTPDIAFKWPRTPGSSNAPMSTSYSASSSRAPSAYLPRPLSAHGFAEFLRIDLRAVVEVPRACAVEHQAHKATTDDTWVPLTFPQDGHAVRWPDFGTGLRSLASGTGLDLAQSIQFLLRLPEVQAA